MTRTSLELLNVFIPRSVVLNVPSAGSRFVVIRKRAEDLVMQAGL